MLLTKVQLGLINFVLQQDKEGKQKQYPLSELTIASDIFKELKKLVVNDLFEDGEVELTSEQKVFIIKLIDDRNWTVNDAEEVFNLKALLN